MSNNKETTPFKVGDETGPLRFNDLALEIHKFNFITNTIKNNGKIIANKLSKNPGEIENGLFASKSVNINHHEKLAVDLIIYLLRKGIVPEFLDSESLIHIQTISPPLYDKYYVPALTPITPVKETVEEETVEPVRLSYDEWDKLPKKVQGLFIMNCSEDRRGSLAINYFEPRSDYQIGKLKTQLTALQQQVQELQEAQRWIPVTERLPESCKHIDRYRNQCNVIVDKGYAVYEAIAYYGEGVLDPDDIDWHVIADEHHIFGYPSFSKPTHWMKIPEYL